MKKNLLFFVSAQCRDECCVFLRRSYRDAEAVLAEGDFGTVAHNDALVNEVVVDAVGIGKLGEEEIGLGGVNLQADVELVYCVH